MIITVSQNQQTTLEEIFAATKHLKPKHKLSAAQMDKLNEKMFR